MSNHAGSVTGRVSRRSALRILGGAGLGLAVSPILSACGGGETKPAPTTGAAAPPATGEKVTIEFKAWAYQPEYARKQLDVFEQQYPNIKVNFEAYPNPKFNETMLANFTGNVEMDAFFNRDDTVAAWSKGGYVRPIDDLPGIDAYKADLFPYVLDAMTVDGKLYGLPYVAIFDCFMWNDKMLKAGGFGAPPKTWDELTQQAVTLKKQGVVEYPMVLMMKNMPGVNRNFWNHVYAQGGNLFDAENQPLFPDKDGTALRVLEWMIEGIHTTKIIDPGIVELDYVGGSEAFAAGRGAFIMLTYSELPTLLDPQKSKIADVLRVGLTPGPSASQYPGASVGFTRMYSISSKTKKVDPAYKAIQFLGGKDAKGQFYYPKRIWIDMALGYGYKSMDSDPEIKEATKKWMDPAVFAAGNAQAKARQAMKTPWFPQWDQYHVVQLQEALTKRATPKDALENSAKKARELAKQAGR